MPKDKAADHADEAEVMQYLAIDPAQLLKEQSAAFDGKKQVWVPEAGLEGYISVEVISASGDDVVVKPIDKPDKGEMTVKKGQCEQMNPPKYEKATDMADLTYLNEASVLYNLRARYEKLLIYTYSGLFCIAVNPYKRLPIYNDTCIKMYRGKRRVEMPPHLFSIVDNAYQSMLQANDNQSMLITGESGAGKTENTKKVIMYIAKVAGVDKKKPDAAPTGQASKISGTLDEQIVEANPLMESFGNAKTIRNNNSSRFGKFIRAHFSRTGKLAGADIESYLLEKNRVTFQLSAERNYHIHYQLLYCTTDADLAMFCIPSRVSADYNILKLGQPTVDGIDDAEEYAATESACVVLGFTPEERVQMYSIVAANLNINNIKMKQRPRDEQAEVTDPSDGERCSHLLGVNVSDFHKSLTKPRVKVGMEFVNKAQNMEQVGHSITALSKKIYEGMFLWQVKRINQALDTKEQRSSFIGVLDIAGFEIFEYNSFDQLCINLTNEKLQQFFNHTMFVLEQEEYKKEGLKWEMIDFAMDLELTIQLIEKPGGIFPMLEEECIVPKATDDTYLQKLHKAHTGKHQSYGKPSAKLKGKGGDFILHHYAGSVGYSVPGWLEKNKDPVNEDTAGLYSKASNPLVAELFESYNPDAGTRRKGAAFQTVSLKHRQALASLLGTLGATTPHFVRCIIPNELKQSGMIDGDLVLHQLRCNGVLEGIRICRKGFPSRMIFADFKQRYQILASGAIPQTGFVDGKIASEKIITAMQLEENEFRIGLTKVFFRSGIIGELEDMRDERLSKIISQFQAYIKGNLQRIEYQKMRERRIGLAVIQRNVRKHFDLKNWTWWLLWNQVQPMLTLARSEDDMKEKEEALKKAQEQAEADAKSAAETAAKLTSAMEEKEKMMSELNTTHEQLSSTEEALAATIHEKEGLASELAAALEGLEEQESGSSKLKSDLKNQKKDLDELTEAHEKANNEIAKLSGEKTSLAKQIEALNGEVGGQGESIAKLNKEKKGLEETLAATTESLQTAEDKGKKLSKEKGALETKLSDTEAALAKEREAKAKLDKEKKKTEGILKETEAKLLETEGDLLIAKDTIVKRDKTIKELQEQIEALENQVKGLQKKVAELLARVDELEDELDNEKKAKAKVEKAKAEVEAELELMQAQLEDAGGATAAQIDVSKKKDAEIAKLRKEMEEANAANESALAGQKQKLSALVAEAQEETEDVKKAKAKSDKEKGMLAEQVAELSSQTETDKKKITNLTKSSKSAEEALKSAKEQIDSLSIAVTEAEGRPSGTVDAATLAAATEEVEHKLGVALKNNKNLTGQLEEAKDSSDAETRQKLDAQGKLKQALSDLEAANDQLEEEQNIKGMLQQKLNKQNQEIASWKSKAEAGDSTKIDELENAKKKLLGRIQEMEGALSAAESKAANIEKVKQRMTEEVEDMLLDLEKAQNAAANMEKKQKKVDQQIAEWKAKADAIQSELDGSQRAERNAAGEIIKLRQTVEENADALDQAKKAVRQLTGEVSNLNDQLSEGGGKTSADVAKVKSKLEAEKEEMTAQLEEVEQALEVEEAKHLKVQMELANVRSTVERKLQEKEDESENLRRNHGRQLEAMQGMLETSNRGSGEHLKVRKALEGHVADLEAAVDGANRATGEQAKVIKRLQNTVKELSAASEDGVREKDESRDQLGLAQKRLNDQATQLDELRLALEQSERARKTISVEASENATRINEVQATLNHISQAKRKAEGDYHALQDEMDELENEKFAAQDRANKASSDAARLMNDLVAAQNAASAAESARASLSKQLLAASAAESGGDGGIAKGLKATCRKMESRIIELESDLDTEARKAAEAMKLSRKTEKKTRELVTQLEDEQKATGIATEAAAKMNEKITKLRVALDESESNAQSLGSKYKKVLIEMEDAEERCEAAEVALQKARQRARGGSASNTRGVSRAPSAPRTPRSRTALAGED